MTGNEYQELAGRTAGPHGDNAGPCWALGLAGEAGEVADYLKKVLYHGHELDHQKLRSELGDVLWYVAMLADFYGHDLDMIMESNINKLKKRYPEGFTKEASINRAD